MTPAEFRKHAAYLRRWGAVKVRFATKTVEMECEFYQPHQEQKAEPEQRDPVVGFQVHSESDDGGDE